MTTSSSAAFPKVSEVTARILVLPATSTDAERVFSAMNRIMTPIRNRLKSETLDTLLRISMNGPPATNWNPAPTALLAG